MLSFVLLDDIGDMVEGIVVLQSGLLESGHEEVLVDHLFIGFVLSEIG